MKDKGLQKVYDDGGDFNDYIEALEENGGKNTTEITQLSSIIVA